MRVLMLFVSAIVYLFVLVFIESELVRIEVRKEDLRNDVIRLENERTQLESQLIYHTNLARIEAAAKKMGYVFPSSEDILGAVE